MDANRARVLELAEQGDWDEVLQLVEANAALAQAQDDFGMLPLHWACTEPSVGLDVVSALLRAFPGPASWRTSRACCRCTWPSRPRRLGC